MPQIRTFSVGRGYSLHVCPDNACTHNCPSHADEAGRPTDEHFIHEWARVEGDTMTLTQMKREVQALYKNHVARQAATIAPSELAKTTFS